MTEEQALKIAKLKEEKKAVILAHYYVEGEVQAIADYVGDSYYLAEVAKQTTADVILFCGVSFMGESAKLLNPDKTVVMPDISADCPMAHMVDLKHIHQVRKEYPDVCVVCYVNSTAEIKAESDVCVTSSNALKIVKALPNKNIFFIPDNNLARYIADQVPEKHFIFNDGYCHVHKGITATDVMKAKELHPNAPVLTHPECTGEVLALSDYIGSTSQIIDYASTHNDKEYIICTETGVFYELTRKNPEKVFYPVIQSQICPNMKKITIAGVINALETLSPEVVLPASLYTKATTPLTRMLELAK